ncbi:MAG: YggS family pyridoxal phosphate-dependent enzyme [Planctomycetota bacterium]
MNETLDRERIRSNFDRTMQRLRRAAEQSDRDPDSITLVSVSKYVDAQQTRLLVDAGAMDLGEARPQQLWAKSADECLAQCDHRWHLIGHLQRNKIRRTLPLLHLLHSVDSARLLESVNEMCSTLDLRVAGLLQVNISGDSAKHGFNPQELIDTTQQLVASAPNVEITGLMAMAGWGTDPDQAGRQFASVAKLRDQIQDATGLPLPNLSMGMTSDFEQAIAHGATHVRVGSALWQ